MSHKRRRSNSRLQRNSRSRFTVFALLCSTALLTVLVLGPVTFSATPTSGTISEGSPAVAWNGPPFMTPTASADCGGPNNAACDNFRLTVVPPSYSFKVEIRLQPFAAGDYDLQVWSPGGALVKGSGNAPGQLETATMFNPPAGIYTVSAAPFAPNPGLASYSATAEIKPYDPDEQTPPGSDNITYATYAASNGMGTGAGEPSVGTNWKSGRTMFQAGLETLRVTWDDCSSPAEADWLDVSFATTSGPSLDPIGFCDNQTGRYFASQLTGTTSLMAYTDDDGQNWTPSQAPFTSGVDHQTVGGGPFHAPLTRDPNGLVYPNATYYCSQDLVTAFCARSDTGGLSFNGPTVPIYTTECGGLHGSVKVAPDGTAYVPNKDCSGAQSVVVSEDNGISWQVRPGVIGSTSGDWDPSVGISTNGTVYIGYGDGDGHPKVAVSNDRGLSWTRIRDVGVPFSIKHTAFPAMVAGDPNRAAFAFLGTPEASAGAFGDDPAWPGEWHLYIAHTYDGGNTWSTVDATPTDPVQRGTIFGGGFTVNSPLTRNLLDFMDADVDKFGRVIVGIADGCISAGCVTGANKTDSKAELATIARQVNGKRLFAQYDVLGVPSAPRVVVKASAGPPPANIISWDAPDDHGSPITGYKVFRNSEGGAFTEIASLDAAARSFTDSAPPSNSTYKVTATNAEGESPACRAVSPTGGGGVIENPCDNRGLTIATDADGDESALGSSNQDIQSLRVAGLFIEGTPSMNFTMKVNNLDSLPVNGSWRTHWTASDGSRFFVSMNTFVAADNPTGEARFRYGIVTTTPAGSTLFTEQGASDGGSFTADGTINISIAATKIGNPQVGQTLTTITGTTQLLIGAQSTGSLQTIDSAGPGSYLVRSCQTGAPSANDDAATTTENVAVTVNVLANDSDPNNQTLTVTSITQPANGTASNNGDGTVTYSPNLSFVGNDSFTYTIQNPEGLSATAFVRITVNSFCPPKNDGSFVDTFEPTAKPGWSVNTDKNNLGPLSPAWAVVTDPGARSASHSWFSDATTLDLKDDRLVAPAQNLSATSRLIFWHRFNFENTYDGGALEVSTDNGASWRDVLAAGGTFVAGGYNGTIDAGLGSPIAGRQAWTGGPLNAAAAAMTRVEVNLGALAGQNVKVRFRLAADPLAIGSLPGQGWWIDDVTFTNTLVIDNSCNKPPVARDDSTSTVENVPVTINVISNDVDPDGDALTITAVTQPANGTAANNGDGTITYTPNTSFVGTDGFNYTINDGNGHSSSAHVTVFVTEAPNQPPNAVNDVATTVSNSSVVISVLANDTDPDGDTLSVANVTQPGNGAVVINPNQTITYTPNPGFVGNDSFSYTADDGHGGTDTASVAVTITEAPNRPPDAVNDAATTQENTPVTINVLANDTDPDGNSLSVVSVTQGGHGAVTNNGNGTVTYNPSPAFAGTDQFTYTISDGRGGSDTANVAVTVLADPDVTGGKVSGSGWFNSITGKSNFGLNARDSKGAATGRISYDTNNGGTAVKGTVSSLRITGSQAVFSGPCEFGGNSSHTFKVQVEDNGEQGNTDRFTIEVYNLAGILVHRGSGVLGGGNIQIHK
jgi:hypothetical protein